MSNIQLFNLIAKLSLDSDDYNAKIEEAKKKGEELGNDTKKKHAVAMVAGWTAVAMAVGAVIKKIADLGIATMKYADQIGDLAEQWGFTTKEIQEFDYWATQNGTTLEALLTGMRGLVNQAQAGSDAFSELGISVKNADGTFKDQRTLFLETITALQKVENQTQRNALQFDIFGRSGIALGQIINKSGAELEALSQKAQDYGLIISEDAIKASSDFNDELDTLKRQFQSLVAELVTGTPEAQQKFEEFTKNLEEKIRRYLPQFTKFIIEILGLVVAEIIRQLPVFIEAIMDTIANMDWGQLGVDIGLAIGKGLLKGLVHFIGKPLFSALKLFGVAHEVDDESNITNTTYSTVTNANVNERTTKVDEKLDITLSVESDGTVAGQQNLDIITDLMTDKINKALGDMVNG